MKMIYQYQHITSDILEQWVPTKHGAQCHLPKTRVTHERMDILDNQAGTEQLGLEWTGKSLRNLFPLTG